MNIGTFFFIVHDIIGAFSGVGVLNNDGTFTAPNAQQDFELIAKVNNILLTHGITEPKQVEAVIAMLPLIFQITGLK